MFCAAKRKIEISYERKIHCAVFVKILCCKNILETLLCWFAFAVCCCAKAAVKECFYDFSSFTFYFRQHKKEKLDAALSTYSSSSSGSSHLPHIRELLNSRRSTTPSSLRLPHTPVCCCCRGTFSSLFRRRESERERVKSESRRKENEMRNPPTNHAGNSSRGKIFESTT